MDDFQRLKRKAAGLLFLAFALVNLGGAGIWWLTTMLDLSQMAQVSLLVASLLVMCLLAARIMSAFLLAPLHVLWQAILHVSPDTTVPAPRVERLNLGRGIVSGLATRVYQFASQSAEYTTTSSTSPQPIAETILNFFPLPVFITDKDLTVRAVSDAGLEYLGVDSQDIIGKPLADSLHIEAARGRAIQHWISECQANRVTARAAWQRAHVRLLDGSTVKQCDIAADFNRDNQTGAEFIITLFDRTETYTQDDQALSFIALAVHELRTPLTFLRGYIEALEEELVDKLPPDLTDYLHKLRVSADQLAAFVANVLNVARIEKNQLSVQLTESDWPRILQQSVNSTALRAQIAGKHITLKVSPDLPHVAADPVTISEVINNLLDNALKYSGNSKEIIISSSLTHEGMVETTIQDFGVGIPVSVLPNLFEKFYRNHRTRNQIGGTGLGLYLSKAIVEAHGGDISVTSKPNEGSSFSFTLQQYAKLTDQAKQNSQGITRHAHGWIKNHSLYRR